VLAQNLAFMLPGPLTTEQVDAFSARLAERHSGSENSNRPIILDKTSSDVKNLGFNNREMEWQEGLRWAAGDMLTALGVREELYPGSQRTTYHNLSEARHSFYSDTIAPEWQMIESDLEEQFRPMLPPQYRNLVFRFDTTVVEGMQEDINKMSTRELNEVKGGVRTPDEYREKRGVAPLPDGMGAKPYVPSGTLPLDAIEDDSMSDDSDGPTVTPAEAEEEVQSLALNGAQISALLELIQQVTQKLLAPETAKALIKAAFPSLTDEQINKMVDSAAAFEPALQEAAGTPLALPSGDDDERALVAEVRHLPGCGKRLPLNNVPVGYEAYCKRCNATFEVRPQ
jgi:hypothetical protein